MSAKAFAAGLILLFSAFTVNRIAIPVPGVGYWEPLPGIRVPVPTINYVNPLGWLVYPLVFVGAILLIFGITSNNLARIILMIATSIGFIYFYGVPIQLLGVPP